MIPSLFPGMGLETSLLQVTLSLATATSNSVRSVTQLSFSATCLKTFDTSIPAFWESAMSELLLFPFVTQVLFQFYQPSESLPFSLSLSSSDQ